MKYWRGSDCPLTMAPLSESSITGFAGEGLFCIMADPRALGAD